MLRGFLHFLEIVFSSPVVLLLIGLHLCNHWYQNNRPPRRSKTSKLREENYYLRKQLNEEVGRIVVLSKLVNKKRRKSNGD